MERFIGPNGRQRREEAEKSHLRGQAEEGDINEQNEDAYSKGGRLNTKAELNVDHERNVRSSLTRTAGYEKDAKRSRTSAGDERTVGALPLRHTWGHLLEIQQNTKKSPVIIEDFVKGIMMERTRPEKHEAPWSAQDQAATGGKLMKEALQLARDPKAIEAARQKLSRDFTASSSRRAKEVKRSEVLQLARSVATNGKPLPLTTDVVEKVAAAMKAAGFRSGPQYLGELRLAHIEAGYELSAWLTRCFQMCRKALERNSGPVRRAPEVKALQVVNHKPKKVRHRGRLLLRPDLAYLWAMSWMLREIELREIRWEHIRLKEEEKLVTLKIGKSKMDQSGAGVRRTLTCCRKESCDPICAWKLAQELMKIKSEAEGKVFLTFEGKTPSKKDVVDSWKWASASICTGHSARRSGAMHYVRNGMNISELAYLGRWKSSVVLTYAEEALEEVAANRDQAGRQNHQRPQELGVGSEDLDSNHAAASSTEEAKQRPSSPGQPEEHPWAEMVTPPSFLWVVTKGKGSGSRPVHLVTRASWAIPLARWSTACGWSFAEKSAEFHFIPKPTLAHSKCRKCLNLKNGRDDIREA